MGALKRKIHRKEQKKKITTAKAKEIAIKEYTARRDEDISEVYGEVIAVTMLYMHNEYGYGEKRLRKWLYGIDDFIEAVQNFGKGNVEEVRRILKEECNIDIQEEYRLLWEAKKKREKKGEKA